jgi:hypothetical protein
LPDVALSNSLKYFEKSGKIRHKKAVKGCFVADSVAVIAEKRKENGFSKDSIGEGVEFTPSQLTILNGEID